MIARQLATLIGIVSLSLAACSPAGPGAPAGSTIAEARPAPIQRTLVAGVRTEPTSVAIKTVGPSAFAGNSMVTRLFNADLAMLDDRGALAPYLAEALPQLHTDSWRVAPDGRMEVTWRLRPGIAWQDGTPLSTEDFLFAWQVYSKPDLGAAGTPSMLATEGIQALDDRTVLVRYRVPFPDALTDVLEPLPRHLLDDAFQASDANAFANLPFWTYGYIGLGPWTLTRWEPGAFIEGVAFDGHVLGRPRIDRVRAVFVGDTNTAMAKILAGEVHVVASGTFITIEQGRQLKRQWDADGGGTVALFGNLVRSAAFQLRPEVATPAALLDPRVRKALASSVDKEELGEALYGAGVMRAADFFIPPDTIYGPAFVPAVTKYAYDPRRAAQLMTEAGFVKGDDGFFASAGGRFRTKLETAVERAEEMTIMNNGWRRVGFDVEDAVVPPQLASDAAARVLFSGMSSYTSSSQTLLASYTSVQCPRAETNYRVGGNRGCWLNPEFDRFHAAFSTTLDAADRGASLAGMAAQYTEDLPAIPLHFVTQPYVWASSLRGVNGQTSDGDLKWNMYEWEWVR
jgi:peptide/nickel transport system substrate-binding protein